VATLDIQEMVRRKNERKEILQSSLEHLVSQLEKLGAVKVMVFGSLVDDTIHSGSDLDVLAVMPQDRPGREWSRIIYSEIDRVVASDILVFNTAELAEEVKTNALLQQVLEKGELVFEKDA